MARGLGKHGFRAVRVTVIDDGAGPGYGPNLTYGQPFRHRWTDKHLHTGVVLSDDARGGRPAAPAATDAAGLAFSLPVEGSAVRGVFVGDPCTEPGLLDASTSTAPAPT